MKWFKKKVAEQVHDELCPVTFCICEQLQQERNHRTFLALQAEWTKKYEMAIEALDGEQK